MYLVLTDFCTEYGIHQRLPTTSYALSPASSDEAGLSHAPRHDPVESGCQAHLACFDKQVQEQGTELAETKRQMLQNAVGPDSPHQYSWYVIQGIGPSMASGSLLPLEEAVERYTGLNGGDKRLGVVKDGATSADLVICRDGQEWFSEDYQKMDSSALDPVVAEAVGQIRQALEDQTQGQSLIIGEML